MSATDPNRSSDLPRCGCGHDRTHFMVSAENHYSFWRWIVLTLGVSVEPVSVSFRCRVCEQVFEHTDDLSVLRRSC